MIIPLSSPPTHVKVLVPNHRLPRRRPHTPHKLEIQHLARRLHELSRTPTYTHGKRSLFAERINLLPLYKDNGVLGRVLALEDLVRCASGNNGQPEGTRARSVQKPAFES